MTAGVTRLLDYQHDDGGWGWWKTDENHPFMTAYAVYGLLETRANGYQVNDWKIRQGLGATVKLYREYPRAVPALKAYMLFVLTRAALMGLEPRRGWSRAVRPRGGVDRPVGTAHRPDAVRPGVAPVVARRRQGCARRRAGDDRCWARSSRPAISRGGSWTTTRCSRTGPTAASKPRRPAVQALAARNPGSPAAGSRRPLSAGQPPVRRVLGEHEADGDGALRPDGIHEGARRGAGGLCRRCLGEWHGSQDGDTLTPRR